MCCAQVQDYSVVIAQIYYMDDLVSKVTSVVISYLGIVRVKHRLSLFKKSTYPLE